MLIDEVHITVKAGNGGNGSAAFKRNAQTAKGGPDGGNGGKGGSVYFQGVNDITALMEFTYKKQIRAEDGVGGGKQNLYGRAGKDTVVFVPIGTHITDLETSEKIEITDDSKILIATGGKGGLGNNEFKSSTNQTPKYAEKGGIGEEKRLFLELKLVADIGFIGLPNAGKSTLLSELTNAHPKIGNYPFTTLEPNLGVLNGLILTDIPGLIEGASEGRGLGIKFLKHVEKTKLLVHCIDSSTEDVLTSYKTVRHEMSEYNKELENKTELLVLTKADLATKEELDEKTKELEKLNKNVMSVSILDEKSLTKLKEKLMSLSKT